MPTLIQFFVEVWDNIYTSMEEHFQIHILLTFLKMLVV